MTDDENAQSRGCGLLAFIQARRTLKQPSGDGSHQLATYGKKLGHYMMQQEARIMYGIRERKSENCPLRHSPGWPSWATRDITP